MSVKIKKPLLAFILTVLITTRCLATAASTEYLTGFSPDGSALNVVLTGIAHARLSHA